MDTGRQKTVIAVVAFAFGALVTKFFRTLRILPGEEERPTIRIRNGSIQVEVEAPDGGFGNEGPKGWPVLGAGKAPTNLTVVANGKRYSTNTGPHEVTVTFKKETGNATSSVSIELADGSAYVKLRGANRCQQGNKKTLNKAHPPGGTWKMSTVTVGNDAPVDIDCGSSAVVEVEQTP